MDFSIASRASGEHPRGFSLLANFIISFGFMPNSLMTNSIGFPASYIGKFDICGLKFIIILLDLDSYLAR